MTYLIIAVILLAIAVWVYSKMTHTSMEVEKEVPEECCGQHAVCERDSLLAAMSKNIEYYNDEELDRFKGREREDYSEEEADEFRTVLYELKDTEVPGWVRSLELRQVNVPVQVMDEIILIVGEHRSSLTNV